MSKETIDWPGAALSQVAGFAIGLSLGLILAWNHPVAGVFMAVVAGIALNRLVARTKRNAV